MIYTLNKLFVLIMLTYISIAHGIVINTYQLEYGGIRYSNLTLDEFVKTMHVPDSSVVLLVSEELSVKHVVRRFGRQGYINLVSMGIVNPTKNDLSRKKINKAPGVRPEIKGSSMMSMIIGHSLSNGIDPRFVMALIKTESNFNPSAKSHKGAMGLMQIMPSTASLVAGVNITEKQLVDPAINLLIGTRHLRDLLVKYRNPIAALSAWNAGEQAVLKYGAVPPYKETINFGSRVISYWEQFKKDTPWKKSES